MEQRPLLLSELKFGKSSHINQANQIPQQNQNQIKLKNYAGDSQLHVISEFQTQNQQPNEVYPEASQQNQQQQQFEQPQIYSNVQHNSNLQQSQQLQVNPPPLMMQRKRSTPQSTCQNNQKNQPWYAVRQPYQQYQNNNNRDRQQPSKHKNANVLVGNIENFGDLTPPNQLTRGNTWNKKQEKQISVHEYQSQQYNEGNTERKRKSKDMTAAGPGPSTVSITDESFDRQANAMKDAQEYFYDEAGVVDQNRKDAVLRGAELGGCCDQMGSPLKERGLKKVNNKSPFSTHRIPGETSGLKPNEQVAIRNSHLVKKFYDREQQIIPGQINSYRQPQNQQASSFISTDRAMPIKQSGTHNFQSGKLGIIQSSEDRQRRNSAHVNLQKLQPVIFQHHQQTSSGRASPQSDKSRDSGDSGADVQIQIESPDSKSHNKLEYRQHYCQQHYQPERVKITLNCSKAIDMNDYNKLKQMVQDLKNQSAQNQDRRKANNQSQQIKRSFQQASEKMCRTCHDSKGAPLVITPHPLNQVQQIRADNCSYSSQPYQNHILTMPSASGTPGIHHVTANGSDISGYGNQIGQNSGSVTNLRTRPNTQESPSSRVKNQAMLLNLQNQAISVGLPLSDANKVTKIQSGTIGDLQQRRANTSHSNRRSIQRQQIQDRSQISSKNHVSQLCHRISITQVGSQDDQHKGFKGANGADSTRSTFNPRSQSEMRSSSVWKMRKQAAQKEFQGTLEPNQQLFRPTITTEIKCEDKNPSTFLNDEEYKQRELKRLQDSVIREIPANQLRDLCEKLKIPNAYMDTEEDLNESIEPINQQPVQVRQQSQNKTGAINPKSIINNISTDINLQSYPFMTSVQSTARQLKFGVGDDYNSDQLNEQELLTPLLANRHSELKALIQPGQPRPALGSTLVINNKNQPPSGANFTSQQNQFMDHEQLSITQLQQQKAAQSVIGGHWMHPSAENSMLQQMHSGTEHCDQIQQSPAQKASAMRSVPFEDFVNNLRTSQELFKLQSTTQNFISQRSNSVKPGAIMQSERSQAPEKNAELNKLTHFHIEAFEDQVKQISSSAFSRQLNNRRKSQMFSHKTQSMMGGNNMQGNYANPQLFVSNVTAKLHEFTPKFSHPASTVYPSVNYIDALLTEEDFKMPVKKEKKNLKKKNSMAQLIQPKQFTKKVVSCTSEMSGNVVQVNEQLNAEDCTFSQDQLNSNIKQQIKTLLLTKEVDDSQHDILKYYSEPTLKDVSIPELQKVYESLIKMIIPVYSGSIDHRINLFDLKRVKTLLQIEQGNACDPETKQLFKACVKADDMLYNNRSIRQGMWCRDFRGAKGHIPSAVEGAKACTIGSKIYLFGGFSRQMFNELRELDTLTHNWSMRSPDLTLQQTERPKIPDPRAGHTMVAFRSQIYIFGGAGEFLKDIQMRYGFNDVWFFDTKPGQKEWHRIEAKGNFTPKKRMNHCAASMGSIMLVSGGYNTETKVTMDDFALFDFYNQAWISVDMYKPNGDKFQSQAVFANDKDRVKDSQLLNSRRMHQMVAVWDKQYHYNSKHCSSPDPKLQKYKSRRQDRLLWTQKHTDIGYQEGFYIFGGMDENNQLQNDLYLVQPDYEKNKAFIQRASGDYVKDHSRMAIVVNKISKFHGEPPCPRIHFGMTHISNKSTGHQLLVVYGGRNDAIYDMTRNVALNDVCIFNINTKTWETLALFGQMPISRWSHVITAVNADSNDDQTGILMLGGVTNQTYCKSSLYNLRLFEPAQKSGPSRDVSESLFGSPDADKHSTGVMERKRQAMLLQNMKDVKSLKQCGIDERPQLNMVHQMLLAEVKQKILTIKAISMEETQSDAGQMSTTTLGMSQRGPA